MEPGDFIKLNNSVALDVLRSVLPDNAIEKFARGDMIAEFRIDSLDEDLEELGAFEELTSDVVETYKADLLKAKVVNSNILTADNEEEEIWLAWDPEEDVRYLVPSFMISKFNRRPHRSTPKLENPLES